MEKNMVRGARVGEVDIKKQLDEDRRADVEELGGWMSCRSVTWTRWCPRVAGRIQKKIPNRRRCFTLAKVAVWLVSAQIYFGVYLPQ
jgi:hypothetical protein